MDITGMASDLGHETICNSPFAFFDREAYKVQALGKQSKRKASSLKSKSEFVSLDAGN